MQRKVILPVLLLCSVGAWAQKRDENVYQKSRVDAKPIVDLTGNQRRVGVDIGKRKIPIEQPLPPLPNPSTVDYHNVGAAMPPMRAVSAKGMVYTDSVLKNDANLFVMMFNPTCEHCEDMTRAFEQNISLFRHSNIVLIAAPHMGEYLAYFDSTTKYSRYPAIKVGLDSSKFIEQTFNYVTLPQINVYDKHRKLIKTFSGTTSIESLKPYIQ